MPDDGSVKTLEDILSDLAAAEQADTRLDDYFAAEARRPSFGSPLPAFLAMLGDLVWPPSWRGRKLVRRCPQGVRRRYEDVCRLEGGRLLGGDYGILVMLACPVLEGELDRLLISASRDLGGRLVGALKATQGDPRQVDILSKWVSRQVPTTMGVQSLVLLALRRGLDAGDAEIIRFLDGRFTPPYRELLATRGMGACLDAIRTKYRNPACHGTGSFDVAAYRSFVRLMVGGDSFRERDRDGPKPDPPGPDTGILFHHWELARGT